MESPNRISQVQTRKTEFVDAVSSEKSINWSAITTAVIVTMALAVLAVVILLLLRKKYLKQSSVNIEKSKIDAQITISNTSNASIDNDDANRLSLQDWIAKKAVSNRYESWHIKVIDKNWVN